MVASSTPGRKNRMEWISGWCSYGRIWCWCSSKYSMGLSTIFLYFFSRSLRAISLAPMLSSLCLEDPELGARRTSGHAFQTPGRNDLNLYLLCRSTVCCGRRHGVGNYLAVADPLWQSHHICSEQLGPGFPKSSGFGKFRLTDFTTDFNFDVGAGASGSLAG